MDTWTAFKGRYRDALWDGSDPLYSPCTRAARGHSYWSPPPAAVRHGHDPITVRLSGTQIENAAEARRLTRDALQWMLTADDGRKIIPGSWSHLIGRYRTDTHSPYQDCKANTREGYDFGLERWEQAIGKLLVCDTSYERIMAWKHAMLDRTVASKQPDGSIIQVPAPRSASYIRRLFAHLQGALSYGKLIEFPGAERAYAIVAGTKFKTGAKRRIAPTEHQVADIVAAADAAGDAPFVLGLALQWWSSARTVDIFGQWVRGSGGIQQSGRHWIDGAQWSEIDEGITLFHKPTSKTGADLRLNLTLVPSLRNLLLAVPVANRIGPIILCPETGRPYAKRDRTARWRKYARIAGVSDDVFQMDMRAGAATDANDKGSPLEKISSALQHSNTQMTQHYIRSKAVDEVVITRLGGNRRNC